MSRTQQLIGQLGLVAGVSSGEDQAAIADDVAGVLPLHRQESWPFRLILGADLLGNVCHGGPALRAAAAMRRHSRIALGPQLMIDGGLVRPAMPQDEAIGRQALHRVRERHIDSLAATIWSCDGPTRAR